MKNVLFKHIFIRMCSGLLFGLCEFRIWSSFKQGQVGAHLCPLRPRRTEMGGPWPWGTGCPGANELMLITGASYLWRGASPSGCHWLGVGPAAERKGEGTHLASSVVRIQCPLLSAQPG